VKHCAFENDPPSASTDTTPDGWTNKRPYAALHKSTDTYTDFFGRTAAGNVNGTEFVPAVAIAPRKCTTPELT
jgi:hypothetical protein